MHEAQLHDDNAFITLTYNDDNLPTDGSLVPEHFQKFMKRLRKEIEPKRVRFFHCGEYGDDFERPHYHACLFGYDFEDKKFLKREGEHDLFTSEQLDEVWGKGYGFIGSVTYESAGYVARYITKKITGARASEHYCRDTRNGSVVELQPEYATMSRRPGLASDWFDDYENDVKHYDEVIVNGHPRKPPRYYDKLLEEQDPEQLRINKLRREADAATRAHDNTPARLASKEAVKKAQLNQLTRRIEK